MQVSKTKLSKIYSKINQLVINYKKEKKNINLPFQPKSISNKQEYNIYVGIYGYRT